MAEATMNVELGPVIGATIPHDLNIADAMGAQKDFDSLAGENGMVMCC